METLSLVIITLNEEENIAACLESAAWADEVVVLDSGSSDRTVDICRAHGARVEHRPWDGYTAQRNAAHLLASGDWILSLDADERVDAELASEIKALLAGPPRAEAGFELKYKVFYRGKQLRFGGFQSERHLRLFRRGRGRYGDRAVHEAMRVDGPVGVLSGHIEHYTYNGVSDFLARMERYSTLSAEEYARQGRRIGPAGIIGHSFFNFFQMYFLRLGFLDGYEGFLLAGLYSFYNFVKYAKLREINSGPK